MPARTFPQGFLWGAATSAMQVEGGGAGNDWAEWEQEPGRIHDGSRVGDGCGWWAGRAEDDLALAASLGHNAHRLSLEWSRLEPEPGRFDDAAFARYAQILDALARLRLRAVVTLNHFALPRWAAAQGGWAGEAMVARFARYAAECARRLGSKVALFATLNEPSVLALVGYGLGHWPPGKTNLAEGCRALANMLRAHAAAREAMRTAAPHALVGLVLNAPLLDPARPRSVLDRAAAAAQDFFMTGAIVHALQTGLLVPPLLSARALVPGLRGSLDWLGVNYYGRYEVQFDPAAPALFRHVQRGSIKSGRSDWGQVAPRGLTRQLVRLSALRVPLYVTENGVRDEADLIRPRYLVDHVAAVHDALRSGADVRGYFHWSLIDNFELAEGWSSKFGLIELDRRTGRRTVRESARVFERICRANALPD